MEKWFIVAATLTLAGCLPAETSVTRTAEDPCGAAGLQHLVGQGYGALSAMVFDSNTTRFLEPGMAYTMDYSPARLNIEFDRAEKITRVFCG